MRSARVMILVMVAALMGAAPLTASARAVLDPSFGKHGMITVRVTGTHEVSVDAVKVDHHHRIVIAGDTYYPDGQHVGFYVARLHPNGSLDTSFGRRGIYLFDRRGVISNVAEVAIAPDDSVALVGYIYLPGSLPSRSLLVRLTASGRLDRAFMGGMITHQFGFGSEFTGVVVTADGRVIASGALDTTTPSSSPYGVLLAGYTARGRLDASFGNAGTIVNGFGDVGLTGAGQIALDHAGHLVVAARVNTTPTTIQVAEGRFSVRGRPDAAFGAGGFNLFSYGSGVDAEGSFIAPRRHNGAVVLGVVAQNTINTLAFVGVDDQGRALASYRHGGLDLFSVDGQSTASGAINIDNHDRVVVGVDWGNPSANNTIRSSGVLRLRADGSPDSTFAPSGLLRLPARNDFPGAVVPLDATHLMVVSTHKSGSTSTIVVRRLIAP